MECKERGKMMWSEGELLLLFTYATLANLDLKLAKVFIANGPTGLLVDRIGFYKRAHPHQSRLFA